MAEQKQRGRKAGEGTVEARNYVNSGEFERLLTTLALSVDAKTRILKAVKFGLGIK